MMAEVTWALFVPEFSSLMLRMWIRAHRVSAEIQVLMEQ